MSGVLPRRARLQEVADRAGVSKSIASRVLNGDPSVSVRDQTRKRVLSAARTLSYHPDPVARALAGSLTGALALLVPAFDNPAYTPIVRGAYRRAREHGLILLSAEDYEGQQADEAFTNLVQAGRIDGLLIASALPARRLLEALRRHWVPHVFVNRSVPGEIPNVVLDVSKASRCALEFLLGQGHRRVGHVAGPVKIEAARRREQAFLSAAAEHGLPEVAVERAAFSLDAGRAAASRLLTRHPEITALYVSSFLQAVGVLQAAAALSRPVPGELSVLAYEDVPMAEYLTPTLSTVAMPMDTLGSVAVDAVLEQIAGEPPRVHLLDATPEVIERESTAPPAERP